MKRRLQVFVVLTALLFGTAVLIYQKYGPGKYTYLVGTVTKYDPSPAAADGDIIFSINGTPVGIGGGLTLDQDFGTVYSPIHEGDHVRAKLVKRDGSLSIYHCPECYIKKLP